MRRIIDDARVPIFGIDCHGQVNEWNGASAKLLGFSKGQVFGRPLANFFSDDPGFTVAKSFDRARQGEEVQPVAASMIVKGGGLQRLMLHPALRGDVGEDVICVAHEVEAVKESPVFDEEDFNAVLDKVVAAVPTPSLLLDVAGKVTAWNDSAEKLSGFKQDEVLGRPLQELICGDGDELDSMIVDTLDGNETFGFESVAQWLGVFPVIDTRLYSGSTCVVRDGAVRAKHPL
ncbi:unnamed protein product [Symbiodinium sp. CCMP2592]|nr:unnamed protein product [Symbiodinium sp. CCMP2592]